MVNQDIIRYFREGVERGYTLEYLKQNLLKNGYDEEEITQAIEELILTKQKTPAESMPSGKNKPLIAISILVVIIAILGIVALTLIKGGQQVGGKEAIVNTDITAVKCDGSTNQLSIEPGYIMSTLQITNNDEKQLEDLNNNKIIETAYTISTPEKAKSITESYYLVSDPAISNGTQTIEVSENTTQFLTITKSEGIEEETDTLSLMIKSWQSSGEIRGSFGYNNLHINKENHTQLISYVCEAE